MTARSYRSSLTVQQRSLESPIVCYVESETDPNGVWPIRSLNGWLYCSCPSYQLSTNPDRTCKHMPKALHILASMAARSIAQAGTYGFVAPAPETRANRPYQYR